MEVAFTPSGQSIPIVEPDQVGFNGLTSESFMRLLITQLQNQDPLEPVGNDELLSQISMMRNLQSNIELGDALKSITTNQQLSTASTFIGRVVTGTNSQQQLVTGLVDRAFLRDSKAFIGIGNAEIALGNVASVQQAD